MSKVTIVVEDQKVFDFVHQQKIISDSDIFKYMFDLSGQSFRHVKNRQTIKVTLANNNYFIKKHFPLSALKILTNVTKIKPISTAIDEHDAITAVQQLGIKTLDTAAYGIKKNYLGQTASFLITKAIEPNIDLDKFCEAVLGTKFYFKFKRIVIKHIAQTTRTLHLHGLNHRDYYLCHYLLNFSESDIALVKAGLDNQNNEFLEKSMQIMKEKFISSLYLIDLHRMQIRNKVPPRYIVKDLSAMLFSVRHLRITKRDYIRFLKIYLDLKSKQNFKDFFNYEQRLLARIQNKASVMREKG